MIVFSQPKQAIVVATIAAIALLGGSAATAAAADEAGVPAPPHYVVSTLAGGTFGKTDGQGSAAKLYGSRAIVYNYGDGSLYVNDAATIRRVALDGTVTTIIPATACAVPGCSSGATGLVPTALAADRSGNMFGASKNAVYRIGTDGVTTLLAGEGTTYGHVDGVGGSARFENITALATDADGNVYVGETAVGAHPLVSYIRKVSPDGTVTTVAGAAESALDGPVESAGIGNINGLAVAANGDIYFSRSTYQLRKLSAGVISQVNVGPAGHVDGPLASARFQTQIGLSIDPAGAILITDTAYYVRQINTDGMVYTLGGSNPNSTQAIDGPGESAQFSNPFGIVKAPNGHIYVADTTSYRIREMTPDPETPICPQ